MGSEIPPADTWPGYNLLGGCEKWCYTACIIENQTLSATPSVTMTSISQCASPTLHISGADPQDYHGFVSKTQCTEVVCICSLEKWPTSLQMIYDCGVQYCNMSIGTATLPDEDFQETVGVLADFCSNEGYHLSEWILDLSKDYNSSIDTSNTDNNQLSKTDQITISTNVVLGLLMLIVNLAMLYLQRKQQRRLSLSQQISSGSAPNPADTHRATLDNNGVGESAPTRSMQSSHSNDPAHNTHLAGSGSSNLPISGCAIVHHDLVPPSPQQPQRPKEPVASPHEGISDKRGDQARDSVDNGEDHEKNGEKSDYGQKPDHAQGCSELPQEVPTTPRTLLTKV